MEIAAIVVAAIGLTAAVVKYFTSLKGDLREIHLLVNSRLDELLVRNDQLIAALESAGVEIPEKPDAS